jgi:hypothetical protein
MQPGISAVRFRSARLPDLVKVVESTKHFGVQWIAFALLLTFVSMRLSARLAPREEPMRR